MSDLRPLEQALAHHHLVNTITITLSAQTEPKKTNHPPLSHFSPPVPHSHRQLAKILSISEAPDAMTMPHYSLHYKTKIAQFSQRGDSLTKW